MPNRNISNIQGAIDKLDSVFRDAIIQSPVSTWIADDCGTMIFENAANRRLFGIRNDEQVIGRYNLFKDAVMADYGLIPRITRLFNEAKPFSETLDYDFSKNGHVDVPHATRNYLRIFMFPIKNSSGSVQHVVVQNEDYAERHQTEEALKDSEERFRILSSNGFEGLIIHDKGVGLEVNDAFIELMGYDRSELIGKSEFRMLPDESLHTVMEHIMSAYEEPYEAKIERKDGSIFIAEIRGKTINYKGIRARLTSVRDVTKEKAAEQARLAMHEQYEAQQRQFYRQTIQSATGGKLIICDPQELELLDAAFVANVDIRDATDISKCRSTMLGAAERLGMEKTRAENFTLCVGEAATNALKHAGGGSAALFSDKKKLRVRISDRGAGMDALILPRATLELGFSTEESLGMGYAVILSLADRTLLATGPSGTTVVVEMDITKTEKELTIDSLPDIW